MSGCTAQTLSGILRSTRPLRNPNPGFAHLGRLSTLCLAMEGEREPRPEAAFADFLESTPPGAWHRLAEPPVERTSGRGTPYMTVAIPDVHLHCASDSCGGHRIFRPICTGTNDLVVGEEDKDVLLEYRCRNCDGATKYFAVLTRVEEARVLCYKLGEYPAFGPRVPSRLISLIGPDRDLFLRGRRCENQGLGIGAFAYYRRVVDNQWRRLLDETIKVAKRIRSPGNAVAALEEARSETQFTKAVSEVGVPDVLKIGGHNPLTLIHRALSEGLHDHTDEGCLELAASIRVVLYELAERIALALKDEREMQAAVARLVTRSGGGAA